ncbi:MAG: iron-sulfur cluster assembly scaffold protein [Brevundimonas diminuta]|jgi:NifU-like protein involved in Fe-S cluster formation|uniref:Iron-sulfur cluster assembly scaffold protein n=1 Tax=Brevundimonas diminuta TaxID=293 RepID=A0A1Z3LYY5_BREDI|nr:iron-sulfur cluster assembly scaffold protein [Brevundimonas diminuta]ASD27346.1 iron-sulfur cluster assembly scaffold protein [Brevundimonas diminuta]MBI2250063.1 iron-sulfur cluster assembly scaffold protein [Brevundimonas diminuta]
MTPDDPLASLYHDRIRTLAAAVRNDRRLEGADLSLTQVSPLCGSRVTLDIALDAALRIKAFGWRVRTCTLGAAATALVVRSALGLRLHAAAGWHDAMQRRLEGEDAAVEGLETPEIFDAARSFRARHGAVLLPFAILAEACAIRPDVGA